MCLLILSMSSELGATASESRPIERIRNINHSFDIRGFAFLNPWLRFATTYRYHPFSLFDGRIRPFLGLDLGLAHFNCYASSCKDFSVMETQIYSSLLPGVMFVFPSTGGILAINAIAGVGHSYMSIGSNSNMNRAIEGATYSEIGVIRGMEISIFQYILGNYGGLLGLHFGISPLYAVDQTLNYSENGVRSQLLYNSGSIRTLQPLFWQDSLIQTPR